MNAITITTVCADCLSEIETKTLETPEDLCKVFLSLVENSLDFAYFDYLIFVYQPPASGHVCPILEYGVGDVPPLKVKIADKWEMTKDLLKGSRPGMLFKALGEAVSLWLRW